MRIAVISDLHLAADPRVNQFGHEPAAFHRFLDFLEGDFEKIVLGGDIWECLRGRLPGRPGDELRRARAAHPDFAERFAGPQYIALAGNHDEPLHAHGTRLRWLLDTDGVRVLFTHGHEFDWLYAHAPAASHAINFGAGWLARAGMSGSDAAVFDLEAAVIGIRSEPRQDWIQRQALKAAAGADADVVVMGHTHVPGVHCHVEHGGRLYMNSGTCSGGQTHWLAIDTARGVYRFNDCW